MLERKNLLPRTLTARFLLIISIPMIIAQVIGIYIFYKRHWYNVSAYMSRLTSNELQLLVKQIDDKNLDQAVITSKYLKLDYHFYEGRKLNMLSKIKREEYRTLQEILDQQLPWKAIVKYSKDNFVVFIELNHGVLEINLPAKRIVTPTTYIFVYWIIGISTVLTIASLIFSKNQLRSIIELTRAVDYFGRGVNKKYEFIPSGATEVKRAGAAFLKMKDRIEKFIEKRTQMLAMVSHDLRTPLTRLKLQLELMSRNDETESMKEDLDYMEHIVNSYLDFARGEGVENTERINLTNFLKEYIHNFKLANQNFEFIIGAMHKDVYAEIKIQTFKRAIGNIISNSQKFASKLMISCYLSLDKVNIEFEDNGPGIEDDYIEEVFKPFYKVDEARTLDGSVGLGLTITKAIVSSHQGNIILTKGKKLKGLNVKIVLPTSNL